MQYVLTGLMVVVWWAITRKLDKIDGRLDKIEDRQGKAEKDCVTWADMEKERLRLSDHDRRITVIETTCKSEHGK
jgi:hypothetical protein